MKLLSTRAHRSGFVLLMVLIVLALAASVLALTARRSCALALRAGAAHEELQTRWGARSCRDACLRAGGEVLAELRDDVGAPTSSTRAALPLGGVQFHLLLADEQAKANANALAARAGTLGVAPVLRRLQAGLRRRLPVRPRPAAPGPDVAPPEPPAPAAGAPSTPPAAPEAEAPQPPEPHERPPQLFLSLEQLFDVQHPSELVGTDANDVTAASRVTCWGNGRVNVLRAGEAVLREAFAGVLAEGDLAKLAALRRERPGASMADTLALLKLPKEQARAFAEQATDASECYSLWVIAEGRSRRWHFLYVTEGEATGPDRGPGWTFTW